MEPLDQRLVDLRLESRHRTLIDIGLETDGIGVREFQRRLRVGRVETVVHVDLRDRIVGAHPLLGHVVGMVGVLGIRRQGLALGILRLLLLGILSQAAVGRAIVVHVAALALERVLDRIEDRKLHDVGMVVVERELALVSAAADRKASGHARRKVEADLVALTQLVLRGDSLGGGILLVELERIEHRQRRTVGHSGRQGVAITEIGHVVGVFREGADLVGPCGVARDDDVARKVAAREIESHPAGRVADRFHIVRGSRSLEHIDVVAAVVLEVLHQIGVILGHPRLEGHILELVERFGFLLGAGCEQYGSDGGEIQKTCEQFHMFHQILFRVRSISAASSLDRIDREEPRQGALTRDCREIRVAIGHVVGHVGLHLVALAATQ